MEERWYILSWEGEYVQPVVVDPDRQFPILLGCGRSSVSEIFVGQLDGGLSLLPC